jgi:hypothetical protein
MVLDVGEASEYGKTGAGWSKFQTSPMLKYLRIAVTALCLTACVLLIALWVRSYSRFESNRWLLSAMGRVYINGRFILSPENEDKELDVEHYQTRFGTSGLRIRGNAKVSSMGADFVMPYWTLTLLAAILAAVPWLPWSKRFSLRTLLIVTTLIAVALGLIVWSM